MKLTRKQIEDITRGALSTIEDDAGLHFRRFSEAQEDYIKGVSNFTIKVFNTAGVRFDFWTDSEYLALTYSTGLRANSRSVTIDTYVDGAFVHAEDIIPDGTSYGNYRAELVRSGKKHVTVYLPHMTELVLEAFELSDGAALEPYTAYSKKVLMCGDSITQGHHTEYASLSYANRLARNFGWDMLNQAVAGYWFDEKWLDGSIGFAPELITVAFGTNDWYIDDGIEAFERETRAFFARLTTEFANVPVAVITPIWRVNHDLPKSATLDEIRGKITEVAGEFALVHVIDASGFVPHLPEFFADDGVHPNALGHAEYARGVAKELIALGLEK